MQSVKVFKKDRVYEDNKKIFVGLEHGKMKIFGTLMCNIYELWIRKFIQQIYSLQKRLEK